MISANMDSMFCTKEEGAAAFETKYDASEFFIMSIIVALGREETARIECDW